jgi:hypothetical protein
MDDALNGRHGPGVKTISFHNRGIHPSHPIELQTGSCPSIEESASFQDTNGVFDGAQSRTLSIQ